jgi:pimeloyl-ACP methyl ester carboxylesterase
MPTTTINGLKHYYEDHGSGEVLVMLHGANGSSKGLVQHFEGLGKHFRVIAPDMRSMGQSEHVASMPKDGWVQDVLALLDQLGVAQAYVYGNSLGSRVAMRFAIEHPDRIKGLIVSAPHTYLTTELNDNLNRAGGSPANLSPEAIADLKHNHGDDWENSYRNYYNIRNVPELQDYFNLSVSKPMMEVVGNYTESVTKIQCPILVIQSDGFQRGRGTYYHALELKEELPQQVNLAIVPSFGSAALDGDTFRSTIVKFAAYVATKAPPAPVAV